MADCVALLAMGVTLLEPYAWGVDLYPVQVERSGDIVDVTLCGRAGRER